jgi:hypothetical protein
MKHLKAVFVSILLKKFLFKKKKKIFWFREIFEILLGNSKIFCSVKFQNFTEKFKNYFSQQ